MAVRSILNTLILICAAFYLPAQNTTDTTLVIQPFYKVELQEGLWKSRLGILQKTLLPVALKKTQPAVENLRRTAHFLQGVSDSLPFAHRYIASDLYKVMEGASYLLMNHPDTTLENHMDEIIDIIANAQQPDGYLYEAHITGVAKNHAAWGGAGMGDKPYSWVLHSHELYNMGHMYEAAVAYFYATGKDKWLKVAEKNAQHIHKVFFIGDKNYNDGKPVMQAPGHEELELALVKLYDATGNKLYLQMAEKFLSIRGKTFRPEGEGVMSPTYSQQHLPVREQREAVGHAVRAAYLYSAMADVSAATGDKSYAPALTSIWENIINSKMHITGGLGAVRGIEGFGPKYVLPNKEAYNETCAAVGNVLFNHKMFLMQKDGKYADVAEVALLNNVLAGVNLEGNKFFYVNPLEADGVSAFNFGNKGRSPWFNTACCPTNLSRLIPQVAGMMYAHTDSEIFSVLFGSNKTHIGLKDGGINIDQTTEYPFGETILYSIYPDADKQTFSLKLRIPTWASGESFVPGDLYQFVNKPTQKWKVLVNKKEWKDAVIKKGFVTISREWKKGDVVELYLPMEVRFSKADVRVEADAGKIAVSRGPLVYCAEQADNKASPQDYFLERIPSHEAIRILTQPMAFNKKVPFIQIDAKVAGDNGVQKLTLLPYHLWNNRGNDKMVVWVPVKK